MVTQFRETTRRAAKTYRCGMCAATIGRGDFHRVSVNLYDGRVYNWRECLACDRDSICNYAHDWSGGYHDEGVNYDVAQEWADETVGWPTRLVYRSRDMLRFPTSGAEQRAARNWLARAAGDE